jgi:cell division protein FtsA
MAVSNVAGIDVGSNKICTVIGKVDDGRIVGILGMGQATSRGVQKGIIVDLEDATRAIRESVHKAQGDIAPKVRSAVVGFSGKHISSTNPMVSVDTRRRDHLVTELAIAQADRKIQAVVFPDDRDKVQIIRRHYALDRIEGIKNPLGMHGFRLDLEAHIVTADYAYMQNLRLCLERAGVPYTRDSFVASCLASSEAVLEPEDKHAGVIVADIGGGTTGIAVYREGSIWHTSALPVGGRQVTNDLAVGLNIPFSAAEELKLKVGGLYPERTVEGATAELTGKYNTSAEEVCYIIRARTEEILRMVVSKSPYVPNVLVLTGGGANLPGLEQFAREVVGLQVRIGVPRVLPDDGKGLDNPAYATGVGLLLWGSEREGTEESAAMAGGLGGFYTGLRSAWRVIWSRRPRITFGPPSGPEA